MLSFSVAPYSISYIGKKNIGYRKKMAVIVKNYYLIFYVNALICNLNDLTLHQR